MQIELAKLLGGATLGAALGIVGSIYGKAEPGWTVVIVAGFLAAISLAAFIYARKLEEEARRNTLERDAYEECRGTCGTLVPRGFLWRLPPNIERGGFPVCFTCFIRTIGRPPHPRMGDHFAYRTIREELAWVKAIDRAGKSLGIDVKSTLNPSP